MGRIKSTIATLQRKRVSPVDPTDAQALVFNAALDQWEPGTVSGGGGDGGLPDWVTTTDDPNTWLLTAAEGQTDPLLELKDSDGNDLLRYVPADAVYGGGDLYLGLIDFFAYEHWDGAGGPSGAGFNAQSGYTNGGSVYFQAADKTYLRVQANEGQTDPLLDLRDSANAAILQVTGDDKIGFFGAAPVAQQTGVPVTDAGIHAALVALGLITA